MERGHLEDPGAGGRIILKWILERLGGRGLCWCGSGWGRVAGSIKCGGISLLAEELLAFQEGLCSEQLGLTVV